jgi:DNA mismatch endonuclease, patch repair protein
MDNLTKKQRSKQMRLIRSVDTKPELLVRGILHRLRARYQLHRKDLPGRPDLVFPWRGKIIFIHGCFWHGHLGCRLGRVPKSRVAYWTAKISRNRQRDTAALRLLRRMGWKCLVLWECQLRHGDKVAGRVSRFLSKQY